MRFFLITVAIGVLWVLAAVGVSTLRSAPTLPAPSSSSCSELQSEFNAAYARSRAYHAHGLSGRGALDTMNSADAQMRAIGCYR